MSDTTHTIISFGMVFMAHMWGYWRAAATERTQGIRECLEMLQDMGIIGNFTVEETYEDQENE